MSSHIERDPNDEAFIWLFVWTTSYHQKIKINIPHCYDGVRTHGIYVEHVQKKTELHFELFEI